MHPMLIKNCCIIPLRFSFFALLLNKTILFCKIKIEDKQMALLRMIYNCAQAYRQEHS